MIELFLQARPALAVNLVHYIVERELDSVPPHWNQRRRLEQSYAVLHKTTVDDYVNLGFDVRSHAEADKLREPNRLCVADSGQCQVIEGPFNWLSKTWRLRYNGKPTTVVQTLPLEANVSSDTTVVSCPAAGPSE